MDKSLNIDPLRVDRKNESAFVRGRSSSRRTHVRLHSYYLFLNCNRRKTLAHSPRADLLDVFGKGSRGCRC